MDQAELTTDQVRSDPIFLDLIQLCSIPNYFPFEFSIILVVLIAMSSILNWNCVIVFWKVLSRDIPWETYMSTKLISGTSLQLLRRYDHRSESQRAQLLDDVIF